MIAWMLTTHSGTHTSDLVADVASDRIAATAAASEALRRAILEFGHSVLCDQPEPRFVVTMDGEVVASIRLRRTEIGKLTVDDALTYIDQFERSGMATADSGPAGIVLAEGDAP